MNRQGKRIWTNTEILDSLEILLNDLEQDDKSYSDDFRQGRASAYRLISKTIQNWRSAKYTVPARKEVS